MWPLVISGKGEMGVLSRDAETCMESVMMSTGEGSRAMEKTRYIQWRRLWLRGSKFPDWFAGMVVTESAGKSLGLVERAGLGLGQ